MRYRLLHPTIETAAVSRGRTGNAMLAGSSGHEPWVQTLE
jgi:hypothetical protein